MQKYEDEREERKQQAEERKQQAELKKWVAIKSTRTANSVWKKAN